jgi:anti-anti-sigma regulatory factor
VVLHVSGQLTGDDANTLRTVLEQERAAFSLDLKNVRLVDSDAVKLLATLEASGVKIENCPRYIREWIRRERDAN